MDFNKIWENICKHQGEEFNTKKGLPFTYTINDNFLTPDRTGFPLNKEEFRTAFQFPNLKGPGQISNSVMGSSYVYAVLTDKRIKA